MKEAVTKERILNAAEEIMLEGSFHSVGLNQILSAVKVPKGSFYHYFESKEQFGVEILRHYAECENRKRREILLVADKIEDPVERLLEFFHSAIDGMEKAGGKCPCLIQKLATEVSNFSEPMREELAKGFSETIRILEQVLDEAIENNIISDDVDTARQAELILDVWTGAQQRATIFQNVEPLRQTLFAIQKMLKKAS